MILKLITDGGKSYTVTEEDATELFDLFVDWRRTVAHSLKERRAWDALLVACDSYLEDIGQDDDFTDHVEQFEN